MKKLLTLSSLQTIILLMTIACLTASCAKKYGCYYSAVPVTCPTPETLKPTGAWPERSTVPFPGDLCPVGPGIPAGLR